MRNIKKINSEGFYILESKVAANSNYIENLGEARTLLIYANYYLKDFLTIHEYFISRHGWQFAVGVKPRNQILQKYAKLNIASQKGETELWRIISERIRLFISTYVRMVNLKRGRKGTLVQSSYKRYYFESLQGAKDHLKSMRNQMIRLYQRKPKYRGLKIHYRIPKKLGKGHVLLCSLELKQEKKAGQKNAEWSIFSRLSELVLPKLINSTLLSHSINKSPPNHHSQTKNSS